MEVDTHLWLHRHFVSVPADRIAERQVQETLSLILLAQRVLPDWISAYLTSYRLEFE
jgi:hypothetical protein